MMKTRRRWWASVLTVGTMLVAFAGSNTAQEKKAYEKHDTTALYDSLKDVINLGARMFNEQGDHAGCYRLYQGSLLTVRPFLSPGLQKKIDDGMAAAEKMQGFADRAFRLREVLDEVRTQMKPAAPPDPVTKKAEEKKVDDTKKEEKKKAEEKKVDDTKKKAEEKKVDDTKKEEKKKAEEKKQEEKKKAEEKKTEEKKQEEKKKADEPKTTASKEKGQLSGKITFQGKPIAGGYFVTLISAKDEEKKFSSTVQKDGLFQFSTPIPVGDYSIAVEPIPTVKSTLPPRYQNGATSSLSVRVLGGRQYLELSLVN